MKYAKLHTDKGEKLVSLEPTGFGQPYQALHDQTDVSINELWQIYSSNGFKNPMAEAGKALHKKIGWWAEITRDVIGKGEKGNDDKGRLHVKYTANAGRTDERIVYVFAPKDGFWVPTNDGVFQEYTGVPFETVKDRNEAIKRCEARGIPKEQVSKFYRLDNYGSDRFVGRCFVPGGGGRFVVNADWLPSGSGLGWVASRPAIETPELVMEVGMKKGK